jgi:hypothetical protein
LLKQLKRGNLLTIEQLKFIIRILLGFNISLIIMGFKFLQYWLNLQEKIGKPDYGYFKTQFELDRKRFFKALRKSILKLVAYQSGYSVVNLLLLKALSAKFLKSSKYLWTVSIFLIILFAAFLRFLEKLKSFVQTKNNLITILQKFFNYIAVRYYNRLCFQLWKLIRIIVSRWFWLFINGTWIWIFTLELEDFEGQWLVSPNQIIINDSSPINYLKPNKVQMNKIENPFEADDNFVFPQVEVTTYYYLPETFYFFEFRSPSINLGKETNSAKLS